MAGGNSFLDNPILGPAVFYVSLGVMLVFFWWLLIFDHGVVSAH